MPAESGPDTAGPVPSAVASVRTPILTTDRLVLRPVEAADVPVVSRLWTDPEVRRYLGGPVGGAEVRAREEGCVAAPGVFGVVRRADGVVVGLVVVEPDAWEGRAEVSYLLLPEYWGGGYAREAVAAVVAWARAGIPSAAGGVVALTQEANHPSRRLLEGLGAVVAGRFVRWGEPQVLYVFGGR